MIRFNECLFCPVSYSHALMWTVISMASMNRIGGIRFSFIPPNLISSSLACLPMRFCFDKDDMSCLTNAELSWLELGLVSDGRTSVTLTALPMTRVMYLIFIHVLCTWLIWKRKIKIKPMDAQNDISQT